ncbi:unnamed protein product [Trypanosoma congolense IL3000]|uniref:WGS project CAEQ00000000 data, annotated contig 1530 n=1 Tax=Trypanosoma congolense (strain IL3000) TaxID=1068625 RepID=F9W6V4_TRYCI|nr:unnamed protein product [Trypanosoma congolense IL3000]
MIHKPQQRKGCEYGSVTRVCNWFTAVIAFFKVFFVPPLPSICCFSPPHSSLTCYFRRRILVAMSRQSGQQRAMNALGNQFTCAVILSSAARHFSNDANNFWLLLQTDDGALSPETIVESIHRFCIAHDMKFVDCGSDAATLVHEREAHVALVRCSDATEITQQLLQLGGNPSVITLEIFYSEATTWNPANVMPSDEWQWLRPTPSCLAEMRHSSSGTCGTVASLPATMRCAKPVIRAQLPALGPGSVPWSAAVTLEGMMREVGYKVGCLSKYGS